MAEAGRERFDGLRSNRDMEAVLFAVQASTVNRLSHLRGIRDETRRLRSALEGAPVRAHDSATGPPK